MFPIGIAGRMHLSSAFVQSVQPTLGNPNMQPAVFLSHTWVPLQRRRFGHGTKWTWLMPVLGSAGSGFLRRSTRASGARASWVQKAHAEHVHMDRFRFPTGLLEQGRQSMEQALSSDSIIYLVRSYGRASSFRRMTCGFVGATLAPELVPTGLGCWWSRPWYLQDKFWPMGESHYHGCEGCRAPDCLHWSNFAGRLKT